MTIYASETGLWTGSISYQPSYVASPLTVDFGTGPDDNGIAWIWQSITGWDSPPVVGQIQQRSGDHGGWSTPQYYGPRILTLTAWAAAPDQATRDLARALFQQIIPVNDYATLTYNEPIPKQALFRRSGNISETYPTLLDVVFTCNLVCPDPRKYSTVQKIQAAGAMLAQNYATLPATLPFSLPNNNAPGMTVVTNNGTFETRPVITINGPVTAPAVENVTTGQTVSFSQLTLSATDTLEIDFDTRTATLNGVYRPADIISSWWTIQPGENTIQLDSGGGFNSGGATMSLSYRDAWI